MSLQDQLKEKKICRFCLTQELGELFSIYSRDSRFKSTAPLPVQVMAIASIEVFSSDGMPSYVCKFCRLLFEHSYRFKQMCKRADTLLRQFELTGQWPNPLPKPKIPDDIIVLSMPRKKAANTTLTTTTTNSTATIATAKNTSATLSTIAIASNKSKPVEVKPKKILNSNPADSPEPPVPMRLKKEILDDETILFLDKMENDEELSMDDVQRLIAVADENPMEFSGVDPSTRTIASSKVEINVVPTPMKAKPKLLNKSSIRILNKNAEVILEPRLSAPTLKRDNDGNVAMVTEILDPSAPYEGENEPDPLKNAEPVDTDCFPCAYCERSFPLRQLRDIHMVNHSRQRSFQCPECERSFFSKYDLQKHNLVHTGDRPYKCTVCDKGFTRSTLLHRHEKTHTDIPKYICIYCEKPFISKEQMEQHTQRHLKNRPYQCKICDKSFAFKQGVERHEVTHLREQPYPCQYCKQSFSTPSKLARHLTAHAGERPYPCKFCTKSYLLSHHLTRHLRSHRNAESSFLCGACDKVFKTRDDLICHSAEHAAKTLVCPLCKESFEDLQSVTQHIKDHADREAYACEFCDSLFTSSQRLQEHITNVHAEDMLAYNNNQQNNEVDDEAENNKLEQTIAEFLIDDLPNEPKIIENKELRSSQMKQESQSTQYDQPKILNQIVFKTNLNTSDEENCFKYDESNIVVANEPIDGVDTDDSQQSAKIRKVEVPFPKQVVEVLNKVSGLKMPTDDNRRRKVPSKPRPISAPQNIATKQVKTNKNKPITLTPPIKKSIQPTITSVLNLLPKGVSVRRTTPSNESKINKTQSPTLNSSNHKLEVAKAETTSSAIKTSPIKRQVIRRSNPALASSASNKVEPKQQPTREVFSKGKILNKSPGSSTSVAAKPVKQHGIHEVETVNKAGVKTMKMMLGDKRVKVQKIIVTKAEAAAMAKDGRIQVKDGAMILTHPSK